MTPVAVAEQSRARLWSRLLIPSFCDVFFVFFIFWTFLSGPEGWQGLLKDADTGFHIRIGELLLKTHTLPAHDPFCFAPQLRTWYAFEWLSEVVFGGLYLWAGFKGVVLVTGMVLAATFTVLLRHTVWTGANILVSLGLALAACSASSLHFLARPHVFTMLLLAVSMWILARDRQTHTRLVWILPAVAAVWANLHGGFFLFLVLLGLLVAGCALERNFDDVRRYGVLTLACSAAVVVNPYGIHLPLHVFDFVRSRMILAMVDEFKAPDFRSESQLQFMALLFLGLALVIPLLRNLRVTEALWIVFLAYCSLTSVRHVTAFVIVCVPIIAKEWTTIVDGWKPAKSVLNAFPTSTIGFSHMSLWPAVFLVLLLAGGSTSWPVNFDRKYFPVQVAASAPAEVLNQRILASDQWAEYLIFRNRKQKVFIDSQHLMFGEKLLKDTLGMIEGRRDWRTMLDKYRINAVLIERDSPLASLLAQDSGWQQVTADAQAVLLKRALPL